MWDGTDGINHDIYSHVETICGQLQFELIEGFEGEVLVEVMNFARFGLEPDADPGPEDFYFSVDPATMTVRAEEEDEQGNSFVDFGTVTNWVFDGSTETSLMDGRLLPDGEIYWISS